MTAHLHSRLRFARREGVRQQETEPGTLVTGQAVHSSPLSDAAAAGRRRAVQPRSEDLGGRDLASLHRYRCAARQNRGR